MNAPHLESARAKVNLALHVLGRRPDLYHELDSLVAFADASDRLAFEPSPRTEFNVEGPFAASVPSDESNLVLRAARMMTERFASRIPPLRITLEKNLPVASGVGGGSADAAACLRAIARIAGVDRETAALWEIARALGADVPVCFVSRACRMKGIGAELERIADFTPRHAVLVNPGVALNTADVFAALAMAPGDTGFAPIPDRWDLESLRNDLTPLAIRQVPEIEEALIVLAKQPEIGLVRMSGSGATCFGLCGSAVAAASAARGIARDHPRWWVVATVLR